MQAINNKREFKYEIHLPDGEIATLEYRWLKGNMVLMRTLVPTSARGKGVGSDLVRQVLDAARAANLKIVVYCAFVNKFIEQHPEYADMKAA